MRIIVAGRVGIPGLASALRSACGWLTKLKITMKHFSNTVLNVGEGLRG